MKFNFKSIKFRIWVYFFLFAIVLLAVMWFLQTFFLSQYYKDMKIAQMEKSAQTMLSKYEEGDFEGLIEEAKNITDGDDIYIRIDKDNETVYPSSSLLLYDDQISSAGKQLTKIKSQDPNKFHKEILTDSSTGRRTFVFAEYLNPQGTAILYIVSPLYPMTSTLNILQNQLLYISILGLALAFLLSFYLSNKISMPITSITKSAKQLANGHYGITFPIRSDYSEIAALGRTLNKASYELEKSINLQKDLMANVSHDLRTPLTMIKSYAEMIRDLSGDNPVKRESHLQVIIDETDRLNLLVGDMLTLSSMHADAMELQIKPFGIKETIESILAPYELLEEQEGFEIILNCKNEIYVNGDQDRIKQVFSNLITNAIKYCGTDKKIFINVRKWGKRVHCEVVDHGVGIKPSELTYIWERYYKASSNHVRSTSGTGLGLSIVKEILNLHGARFGAESKVGQGTTIWFELKIAKNASPYFPFDR